MELINQIAKELLRKYKYYETVAFCFIVGAVENTYEDFRRYGEDFSFNNIEGIHNYIKENFI